MAIGVRKDQTNKPKKNVQFVRQMPTRLLSEMEDKRHFERLNEFKEAQNKDEFDETTLSLKNNDEFYKEFKDLDTLWGGDVMSFLPQYRGVFEGREENLEALRDTVSDLNLPTQVIVGEAGRGKTTLVRKFLELFNTGKISNKMGFELVGIEVSLVSAYKKGNNDFIGILGEVIPKIKELEKKAQHIFKKPNLRFVLFIDEIHLISKLVQLPNGESVGVDVIKPAVYPSIDGLIIVGATTAEEYDRYIAPNAPFLERFARKTVLKAFDKVTMKKIGEGHWNYLRSVRGLVGGISEKVVDYILEVNSQYNSQHAEPRKSKDFLSMLEACSFNEGIEPDIEMVKYIFKRDKDFTPDKKLFVKEAMALFNKRIFGQFMAKATIEQTLRARDGAMPSERGKTLFSYLAVGPTGVGKTEGARVLAEAFYGKNLEPIVASVNDYSQRQNGVNDLMRFIAKELSVDSDRPIILDEVEKGFISVEREEVASPMADAFLTIFGEGKLKWINEYGQEFTRDLKSNIVVATTNAGYTVYEGRDENDPRKITSDTPKPKLQSRIDSLQREIEKTIIEKNGFTPELLGRFDGLVCYDTLTEVDAIGIVEEKLNKYQKYILSEYNVELSLGKTIECYNTRVDGLGNGEKLTTHPVALALATVFANMTDSSKGGARQVDRIFKSHINSLISLMKDDDLMVSGKKMLLYVQAVDTQTGEDLTDITRCTDVERMAESYSKEEIRIGIKTIKAEMA